MWRTSTVCHPVSGQLSTNTCSVRDPKTNHEFNLMPLSDYADNHKVFLKNSTQRFLINICKPTLYGHNEMCPPNTSICLDNETEKDNKKRFKNYGITEPNPVYENGRLFMKFASNEKCNGTDKNITSIINFICDATAQVITSISISVILLEIDIFVIWFSVWWTRVFRREKL